MKIVKDFSTDKTTTTDYLDGFQYMNNVLQFFPTAEGYVNYTEGKELKTNYSYVYQYKDHLGNIRLSYTQDPEGNGLKILEENHYYPFGLKHTNYNTDKKTFENGTPMLSFGGDTSAPPADAAFTGFAAAQDETISLTAAVAATTGKAVKVKPETPVLKSEYKYKYQGQERQDELGLNWDSFKWRNYDYAIGRFFGIDKLAEKYSYQSPYNFSENRVIDARELEGLEASLIKDTQSKCIDLTLRVQPVNNTNSVSKEQFNTIVNARIESTSKALSGPISDGSVVKASIVVDSNATLKMEYNDVLDSNGVKSLEGKSAEIVQSTLFQAIGITSDSNTQVNRTQVDVPRNLEFDNSGMPIMDQKGVNYISNTGTHEDLHQLGLNHVSDANNRMNNENKGGTKVTPEQRQSIVDKVEKEQKQN